MPVVCVRHGEKPDVIVQLPDGNHAAVALSATDYVARDTATAHLPNHASHLLDLNGLRRMAQFIDSLRQQGRFPDPSR